MLLHPRRPGRPMFSSHDRLAIGSCLLAAGVVLLLAGWIGWYFG